MVVTEIYEMLWLCFFTWMIWFASKSIQSITDEIENSFSTRAGATGHQVMNWSRRYCSTLKFIDGIDEFFGAALFIITVNIFVQVITASEKLIDHFDKLPREKIVVLIVEITTHMIQISLVIWTTEKMKEKVNMTAKHTLSIDKNGYYSLFQASNLVEELNNCFSLKNKFQPEVSSIITS